MVRCVLYDLPLGSECSGVVSHDFAAGLGGKERPNV